MSSAERRLTWLRACRAVAGIHGLVKGHLRDLERIIFNREKVRSISEIS